MPRIIDNNLWLKWFIKTNELKRQEVATALEVNISTVDRWLVPPEKTSYRAMPTMARKLLICMERDGDFE